jgi:hypothetical protein
MVPFEVQQTRLELRDDKTINLEALTMLEYDQLFTIKKKAIIPYEYADHDVVWVSVTFERSLSLWTYERDAYTLLDLFSDVGGFQGLLISFCAGLSVMWNFNHFENFMVSRLFKITKRKKETDT